MVDTVDTDGDGLPDAVVVTKVIDTDGDGAADATVVEKLANPLWSIWSICFILEELEHFLNSLDQNKSTKKNTRKTEILNSKNEFKIYV